MKTIKVFEGFAGYGGGSFALKQLEIPHEVIGFSEIDKYAIETYVKNHGDIENFGDITKVNEKELPDFDIFLGGFPCQAFSVAGKQKGELDSRGTLFHDIVRVVEEKQPKYIVLENVKGLTSKRFVETFNKILSELDRVNYNVNWAVLNSADYGSAQNRERVWFVCIRKDLNKSFTFPQKHQSDGLILKDILENGENQRYLSKEQLEKVKFQKGKKEIEREKNGFKYTYKEGSIKFPNDLNSKSQTIVSGGQGGRCGNYVEDKYYLTEKQLKRKGKLAQKKLNENMQRTKLSGKARTITTKASSPACSSVSIIQQETRVRKLTPKECFRLMGFLKDEIDISHLSDTQAYKQAGNGWELLVVKEIFKNLL